MPVEPIHFSALGLDLSPRVVSSSAVVASPADNTETIIASVTIPSFAGIAVVSGIALFGWAAFTVGTNGTACTLALKQTNAAGAAKGTSGALTAGVAATKLMAVNAQGFDATPGVATYVLTLTVTAGSAPSTVSAVSLIALAV